MGAIIIKSIEYVEKVDPQGNPIRALSDRSSLILPRLRYQDWANDNLLALPQQFINIARSTKFGLGAPLGT